MVSESNYSSQSDARGVIECYFIHFITTSLLLQPLSCQFILPNSTSFNWLSLHLYHFHFIHFTVTSSIFHCQWSLLRRYPRHCPPSLFTRVILQSIATANTLARLYLQSLTWKVGLFIMHDYLLLLTRGSCAWND